MPKIPTTPKASEITGITMKNGLMYQNQQKVQAVSISKVLDLFQSFLAKSQNNILLGQNIRIYDCPLIVNALESNNKTSSVFKEVKGFIDTRVLFKLSHPDQSSYAQVALVKDLTGENYDAHDALQDVVSLQKLVNHVNIETHLKKNASFTTKFVLDIHKKSLVVNKNLPSLQKLVNQKVLSLGMTKKIAGSGLSLKHLQLCYQRNGREGIQNIFSETVPNQEVVRVTRSKRIVDSVSEYVSRL